MSENRYDTIVVGGGIAGLTAAVYQARAKKNVLLIEKNKELGGLVNSFSHNGFHFDAGVRALESAGIIFPMLEDLGIQLDFVKSPVSVGIDQDILHIENLDSLNDYKNLLKKVYPESDQEIDETIKIIRKVMKHMDVLYGVENPVFKDLKKDTKFIFKKLLPWLPKFLFTVGKINRMNMPVEDFLDKIIKNPSLKDIISQHFFKNTPTFFALSYFSLYLDYYYPKGGVGKLADAVKDKILAYGGEIKIETTITNVIANQNLVKDEHDNEYQYKNLIWAADLKTLYKNTETQGLTSGVKEKWEKTKYKMLETRGSDSVFSLFLEVDEPLESFKPIANGHFFYTPSNKGLGKTHREDLRMMLDNWDNIEKKEVLDWLDKFTSLNTYEISIPGLKDPDLVPDGKTGMIVSFLAEYDLFKKAQESGWYDELNKELQKRALKVLADTIYPMLKDKIIGSFNFTPVSYQNRVGSSEGAIVGWSFENPLPVVHKIHIADRSVLTPIPSILQAGQWAYSPAGVPMSILTGKLAADKVLKSKR